MNAPDKIPDMTPPQAASIMLQYFWDIRGLSGSSEHPITVDVIIGWQKHKGFALEKWERECVLMCDRAFRRAHADVIKYHMEWDRSRAEAKKRRSDG